MRSWASGGVVGGLGGVAVEFMAAGFVVALVAAGFSDAGFWGRVGTDAGVADVR